MAWRDDLASKANTGFAADERHNTTLACNQLIQPCGRKPTITVVEVGFTAKPKEKALFPGTMEQCVNISSFAVASVDKNIQSTNRLGRTPPIYVKLSQPRSMSVRLRLRRTLHDGSFPAGSSTLSEREKELDHLKWQEKDKLHITDNNGELLLEDGLSLSALAGGEYRVQAALAGQDYLSSPNSLRVMRRLYVTPLTSYIDGAASSKAALDAVVSAFLAYDIQLRCATPVPVAALGVAELETLPRSLIDIGSDVLERKNPAFNKLKPHNIALITGEFLTHNIIPYSIFYVDVVRDKDGNFQKSVDVVLFLDGKNYILIPLSDGSQFKKATVRVGDKYISIMKTEISGLDQFSRKLTINIGSISVPSTVRVLRVAIEVKVIKSWAVGWAYNNHPIVYLNMRNPSTGQLLIAERAQALVIHELGHKLHLAAEGERMQPDKQEHQYPTGKDGVSHVGSHCSHGVPKADSLNTDAAHKSADCTMWGALKGISAFCPECQTSLRKISLGGGF